MTISLLTAADGARWEARLVAELGGDTRVQVVRRCVDVVDLLATAGAGLASVVLLDAQLRRLSTDCCDRLRAAGIAIIGVVEPDAAADPDRLRQLGIEHFLPSDAPAAVIVSVIELAVRDLGSSRAGRGDLPTGREAGDDPGAAGEPWPSSTAVDAPSQPTVRGSVVGVWGPTGGPGRTTLAIGLADELARLGRSSLLIDADVYGGVVAATLGLLDESPGIAAACRQAQSRVLDAGTLGGLCWEVAPGFSVLSGISRADRWPELRPSAVQAVLNAARDSAAFTVLDLGFGLETDEELSFDTLAPRRNGATLAALDETDLVLAVGTADPIGLQRLVRGLTELRAAAVSAPVWIVLNRVRAGSVPGDTERELQAALQRFAGQQAAALLPFDLASLDVALLSGRTLGESAPRSALRRGLVDLAGAVAGVSTPTRRRR